MTFSRIKAVGWAVNEKVTSVQLNQLDLDHSKAIDKTGDNLTNSGGITGRVDVVSGGTLEVQTGAELIVHTGGEILFSGGAQNFTSGSMTFNNSSGITMNDTSTITYNGAGFLILGSSATELCAGTLNITSGGTLGLNSGATMHVKSGATATVDGGGALALAASSNVNAAAGANVNFASGSYLNLTSATTTINGGIVVIEGGALMSTSGASFITVATGGTLTAAAGSTVKFDDFPDFVSTQDRYLIESTVGGIALSGTWSGGAQFVYDNAAGGVWSMQLRRTHHGATLSTVTVGFSVGTAHTGVPANLPNLSVQRYAYNDMFNPQSLSNTNPQYVATPGSGSAWYSSGDQQYMTYFCNQNNVIDNGTYIYVLTITDESGANSQALNAYGLVTMHYTVITSQQWST